MLLLLALAWAADAPPPLTSIRELDPEALVAMALTGPEIRQEEALAAAARSRTATARLSPLDGMVLGAGTSSAADQLTIEPKVYVSVNVGNLVAMPSRVRASRQDHEAQAARTEAVKIEKRTEVLALIESIALAEQRVATRRRTVVALDSVGALADRQLAEGSRSVFEVADLEERRARAAEAVAEAEADLRTLRVHLEAAIGAPLSAAARR